MFSTQGPGIEMVIIQVVEETVLKSLASRAAAVKGIRY
jgi:hypothetical protein